MDLFSRLAFDHYGRDAYRFSDEQIRFVFSMGMKLMELPVGSGLSRNATGGLSFGGKQTLSSGHNANRRVEEAQGVALFSRRRTDFFRLFAEFVVFTIYPADCRIEDAETSTFAYLVNLIRVVEDFYHPSNSGRWSNSLIVFLHYLMISLHDRADRERYSRERPEAASSADNRIFYELPYAESHHLDRSMIRRIILLVRKPLFMALFSKDQRSVMTVCSALNHIAWMEPDLILPGILEKVYPSLETHSEVAPAKCGR